jgi:hypothetical protein
MIAFKSVKRFASGLCSSLSQRIRMLINATLICVLPRICLIRLALRLVFYCFRIFIALQQFDRHSHRRLHSIKAFELCSNLILCRPLSTSLSATLPRSLACRHEPIHIGMTLFDSNIDLPPAPAQYVNRNRLIVVATRVLQAHY